MPWKGSHDIVLKPYSSIVANASSACHNGLLIVHGKLKRSFYRFRAWEDEICPSVLQELSVGTNLEFEFEFKPWISMQRRDLGDEVGG